jgi:hypothetical protein
MADEAETKLPRDLLLQPLDLCIPELDDGAGLKAPLMVHGSPRCGQPNYARI